MTRATCTAQSVRRARRTPGCRRADRRSTPARRRGGGGPRALLGQHGVAGAPRGRSVDEQVVGLPGRPRRRASSGRGRARQPPAARRAARRPRVARSCGERVVGGGCGERAGRAGHRIAYRVRSGFSLGSPAWPRTYELSHLRTLEAEAIHIIREVAAEFERPGAAVLRRQGLGRHAAPGDEGVLAGAAAVPGDARRHRPQLRRGARVPRPHRRASSACRLVVGSVQDDIDAGRVVEDTGPGPAATALQTTTLLRAIEEGRFDAVFGGARRDEEKARAKERVFSFRDEFGQWDPKNQRPELWSLYNGRHRKGEHIRVFPLSQLDRARHLAVHRRRGDRAAVDLLRPPAPGVPPRRHAAGRHPPRRRCSTARSRSRRMVRFRTVGDATCTGAVESSAATLEDVDRRGRRHPAHRAGRHPRRRPHLRGRHGRPQEGGLLLMTEIAAAFATAGSRRRRQVHAHRAAALRLQGDLRGPARGRRAHVAASGATSTPTWRCSPTACGPSASRASPSTSPTATSPRPKRKFIIADTPGHIQYTRNMVTGASTADLALILVDARKGILEQTRRHAFLVVAARHPAPRAVRQQDGPRRLGPRSASRRSRPSSAPSP